jgi:hypothetical protein
VVAAVAGAAEDMEGTEAVSGAAEVAGIMAAAMAGEVEGMEAATMAAGTTEIPITTTILMGRIHLATDLFLDSAVTGGATITGAGSLI